MRRSLLAVFFITLFSLAADATTVVPLSFEQLVNASQSVVYGRVADVRAQWTADRRFIDSVVTVEILRGMKGSAGESIAFTVPGGQVGRYLNVIPGAPSFAPGDLAVFFLTAQGPRLGQLGIARHEHRVLVNCYQLEWCLRLLDAARYGPIGGLRPLVDQLLSAPAERPGR